MACRKHRKNHHHRINIIPMGGVNPPDIKDQGIKMTRKTGWKYQNFSLPQEDHDKLREIAKERRSSISQVLREAVIALIDRHESTQK